MNLYEHPPIPPCLFIYLILKFPFPWHFQQHFILKFWFTVIHLFHGYNLEFKLLSQPIFFSFFQHSMILFLLLSILHLLHLNLNYSCKGLLANWIYMFHKNVIDSFNFKKSFFFYFQHFFLCENKILFSDILCRMKLLMFGEFVLMSCRVFKKIYFWMFLHLRKMFKKMKNQMEYIDNLC